MSLKAKVKVGHITNLSEARYCAGMGVDLLGFPVGGDGLKPEQYKQMIEWVAGPEFVLEVHESPSLDIKNITDNYPGHYIEIGSHQLNWLQNKELNFILAIKPEEWVNLYGQLTDYENIKFVELLGPSKSVATAMKAFFPLLINDVEMALSLGTGIALIGSDEEKPGIKDYQLNDILESLEAE
jgi:phosphoribosylanthranilate isomerase